MPAGGPEGRAAGGLGGQGLWVPCLLWNTQQIRTRTGQAVTRQMDKRQAQDPWLQQGHEACPGTGMHAEFPVMSTQPLSVGYHQTISKHCPDPTAEATALL